MPMQNVPDCLVGDLTEAGKCAGDPVIAPVAILARHAHNQHLHLASILGRPGYERHFEPSNVCATSFPNQPRMVSGWRPGLLRQSLPTNLLPMSASVARASLAGAHALRIRFSVQMIREVRARATDQAVAQGAAVPPDGKFRAYVLDSLRQPAEVHLLRRCIRTHLS